MSGPGDPMIPRTVILPNPGGAAPKTRVMGGPPAGPAPAAFNAAQARPGVNPLVDAAADLFDLVVYLQGQASPLDIESLRAKTLTLLRRFEARAGEAGVDPAVTDVARYVIAATLDDQIMAKPWGLNSGWQHATLVGAQYSEVIGGERFFEYLDQAVREPDRYGDLIEFIYLCISLGFQGIYRRRGNTSGDTVETQRTKAFEALRRRRDGLGKPLSLRWQGTEARRRPMRDLLPLWLVASVSVATTAGLFFFAVMTVGEQTARSVTIASDLPPGAEVVVETLDPPAAKPPPPPPPPQEERVRRFLEEEIAQGLVSVFEEGGQVRIRVVGEGMFASGQARVLPRFETVLSRVADALNGEEGRVIVEGHSDAQPINTARFPSNFHLSEARAASAASFMGALLNDADRLQVIGLGATQLLDRRNPNAAVNRRVELVLDRPLE